MSVTNPTLKPLAPDVLVLLGVPLLVVPLLVVVPPLPPPPELLLELLLPHAASPRVTAAVVSAASPYALIRPVTRSPFEGPKVEP
jgi:hypothetical protein